MNDETEITVQINRRKPGYVSVSVQCFGNMYLSAHILPAPDDNRTQLRELVITAVDAAMREHL
jgi:hypothetical protein